MRYFKPDLFVKLQSLDENEADLADAAWERSVVAYGRRLRRIRPHLPEPLRMLLDEYFLHDSDVLDLAHQASTLIVLLRLETPPRNPMVLVYSLTEAPTIDKNAIPDAYRSNTVKWLYDEINYSPKQKCFRHEILLSNGWAIDIKFEDIQVITARGLLLDFQTDGLDQRSVARTA